MRNTILVYGEKVEVYGNMRCIPEYEKSLSVYGMWGNRYKIYTNSYGKMYAVDLKVVETSV